MASSKDGNKRLVESLYEALARGDAEAVAGMMAEDVEWWFHGPRRCEHMRRVLTGEAGHGDHFRFDPRRVTEVGEGGWVVAEGWEGDQAYWVHAWDVEDGVITRFREYFNTWVTVRELSQISLGASSAARGSRDSPAVWQSEARVHLRRSLPGLVLAI
ncbi:wound-induced protein 1 [Phoenix dactylifera]|uniref:Wound-induced protein 1 n=1 Tax=Phoenix dactylifera TaxID=42345 RepID=A0A8B7CZS3_PHODC|nr:wound-induced protein 1 [Phoenix dactylifera]